MTSRATDKNSKGESSNQICRLCMSNESLEEIFKHDQLHKWITDVLAIKISNKDRMSQSICTECRNRLLDFHKYWVRCKEVQGILQAKVREENLRRKTERSECDVCNKVFKTKKLLLDHKRYHGPKKHVCTSCGKSFARRHQLDKHVKVHAKEPNDDPNHTMKESNITVNENSNLKAEPCEEDDFSSEAYSNFGEPTMGAEIDNLSENYKDFDLRQNQVKLEPVPISLPILDGQEEIMDKIIQEEGEQDFIIEDIIVVEKVKIETRPDDNEELSTNENFETMNEAYEEKLVDKNETNIKREDEKLFEIEDIIVIEEVKIEIRPDDNAVLPQNITETRKEAGQKSIVKKESNLKHKSDDVDDNISKVQTVDNLKNRVDQLAPTENDRNGYACSKCGRTFTRQCQLKNHMTSHDIEDDSNNMNDDELSTSEDIDLDYQTPLPDAEPAKVKSSPVKGKTGIGVLQCDICQKVVADKRKLKDHKRCHKPKEHVCPICEKPYLRRPIMLKHMETHIYRKKYQRAKPVDEGPNKCDICQKEFKSKSILYGHKLKVHGPKKHECNICGSRFSDRFSLKMHLKVHVRARDSEEDFLQFKQMIQTDNSGNDRENADAITEKDLQTNSSTQLKQTASDLSFKCGKCHKKLKSQRALWLHYKFNHVPKNRRYCTICSLVFVTRHRLELHMLTHKQDNIEQDKKENVSSQTTASTSRSEIDAAKGIESTIGSEHNSISADQSVQVEKDVDKVLPFQCNICRKTYQTRLKLYLHHRAVHGPKNHNCIICTIRFATRLELKKHLCTKQHMRKLQETLGNDRVSIDSEKDKNINLLSLTAGAIEQVEVQCDICHKLYPNKWRLRNHKRYHGPRVHKCTICEKSFTIRETLNKHMRTHRPDSERKRARPAIEGEPIKCDICQKEFRTRATLWSHNKRAHGPKKHECHICGFRYSTSYILKKHIEMHARHRDSAEEYHSLKQMQQKGKLTNSNENMGDKTNETENESTISPQKKIPRDPPTECWKCHKKFKNQKQLGLHYKFKHVSKNIRKCTLCNKYVTKIRFEKHMRTKHKQDDGVHQYPTCDMCNAVFPTLDQMEKHMEIHGPKQYNCAICDKSFKASRSLIKHLKFHEKNTGNK